MANRKPGRAEKPMQNQSATVTSGVSLDRNIQSKIGQQLRAMYDDVVKEGVPDRFVTLLHQLDTPDEEESSS